MTAGVVLCQDCLRVRPFTQALHEGREACACGGEFCGCPSCAHTAYLLGQGETRADVLGTNGDIHGWTADGGCLQ